MSTLELEHLKHTSSSSNNLSTHSDGSLTLGMLNGNVGIGTASPQTTLDTGYTRVYNSGAAASPTSGKGLEIHYVTSGRTQGEGAYLISYDRDNSAYKQFAVDANNIELSTGGVSRMTIDTNGYVSKPNTPFFDVHTVPNGLTAGQVTDFTGITSNVGGHWDNTNNRFTAPIAGIYQFNFSVFTARTASTGDYYWDLRKNAVTILRAYDAKDANQNRHCQIMASQAMYMNVNDYVDLHFTTGPTSMEASGNHNRFSGFLVG
jgi:hypothetical protein